jgi:hypothetical protein
MRARLHCVCEVFNDIYKTIKEQTNSLFFTLVAASMPPLCMLVTRVTAAINFKILCMRCKANVFLTIFSVSVGASTSAALVKLITTHEITAEERRVINYYHRVENKKQPLQYLCHTHAGPYKYKHLKTIASCTTFYLKTQRTLSAIFAFVITTLTTTDKRTLRQQHLFLNSFILIKRHQR